MKKPTRKTGAQSDSDDVRSSLDLLDSVIGEFDDGLTSAAESEYDRIEAEIRKRPPPKSYGKSSPNGNGLSDKIDDIFSELTEEIYSADKQQKIINRAPKRSESTNSDAGRKLSPIRRVNDPLPTPPVGTTPASHNVPRKNNGQDEVVVYSEKSERPKDIIPLKKSVKAQVHSLETRGRRIPPKTNPTFTKNVNNNRSRSENPPRSRSSGQKMSLTPTHLQDQSFASRVNPKKNNPPPMPEKTKIHLKNEGSNPKKSKNRQRRPDQPLPSLPSNTEPSSLPSSNNYEIMESAESREKIQQYKRSKSVGPVVEAAQRELLASAREARERAERSRSRGPLEKPVEINRNKSKNRYDAQPGSQPNFRKENSSLESARGRSRMKNVERSVSASNGKKPMKGVDVMDPFLGQNLQKMSRQKSMIDLRDQQASQWEIHHSRHFNQVPPPGGRHFHESLPPNQGVPQGVPPPQMRQRPAMMRSATEHDIKVRNRRSMAVGPFEDLPPHIRQHMARQHGFRFGNDGGENGFLPAAFQGGNGNRHMSSRDRQLAEQDAMIMRHLTLESQREFLMRRGFSPSHPFISGEVPIHPELQGRLPFHVPSRTIPLRPDDYQRFKPEYWLQNHNPNPVAFTDLAVLQSELELKRRRELHRQNSQKQQVKQSEGQENNFNSLPWEEIIPRRIGGIPVMPPEHELRNSNSNSKNNSRSKSQGRKEKSGAFGSAWFNPGHVWREAEPDVRGLGAGSNGMKQQGHWLLKERPDNMMSMPPNIDTLRDSGIGLPSQVETEAGPMSRDEAKRSSFGMAIKDKFNKNPNMYFPGAGEDTQSGRGSSVGRKVPSPTKTHTSIEDVSLSDTDTLIHNMSDGSYEKDSSSNLSHDHDSFGSAKGSRSSGNSSLSPHNSMEGSPRMNTTSSNQSQFQPAPGVSLGKKTIRNYTPKESQSMLREFEDRRNNSADWRKKPRNKPALERKSSVERMIDDFHKSLPPPSSTEATMTTANSKRPSQNGTMNSQISNWSAASSAASFDYQPAKSSPGMKKTRSSRDLPSVDEDDDELCHGERVPPEGAPSANGVSPTNFVHRLEVKSKNTPQRRKSLKEDLPPPPPPPPPAPEPESDDFSNLRKLISEGRIAGLNEKPPSFVPPSPPSVTKKVERSGSNSRRPSSAKPPAPSTPKTPKSSHSAERQPSRKNREAPKPPVSNVSTPSSDIKFVGARQRESMEDLTQMSSKKRNEVKRSSSNHGTRPSGFDSRIDDTTTAQFIADCAEKKFNFNPFKGKLFKKKQYSFDFN